MSSFPHELSSQLAADLSSVFSVANSDVAIFPLFHNQFCLDAETSMQQQKQGEGLFESDKSKLDTFC